MNAPFACLLPSSFWVVCAWIAAGGGGAAATETERVLTQGQGVLVSFENGTLTLKGKDGAELVWKEIDDGVAAFEAKGVDTGGDRGYQPAKAVAALKAAKPGTRIFVGSWFGYGKRHGIFIGVNRAYSTGTFVSYRDGDLSLLSTLGPRGSFTKKYGDSFFFRDIPEATQVEESIDGAPYQPAGQAKTVLPTVPEGTLVTVEFLGEGNITAIRIGEPAKP